MYEFIRGQSTHSGILLNSYRYVSRSEGTRPAQIRTLTRDSVQDLFGVSSQEPAEGSDIPDEDYVPPPEPADKQRQVPLKKRVRLQSDDDDDDDDDEEPRYDVEELLDAKVVEERDRIEYYVKWENWTDKHNEWIPREAFVSKLSLNRSWRY
jgi:hypothetical protein